MIEYWWISLNIHINHLESNNLRGLESWQPARDPEGTWVEAMEDWLVDLWKYKILIGSNCQSLYGRIYGRFYSIFYFERDWQLLPAVFFLQKALLHIIDSHRPLWNDPLLINDFMGWDFLNGFRSAGWQNGDPGEIIFCGAICVEREREWEREKLRGCAWVFKVEYWTFIYGEWWIMISLI